MSYWLFLLFALESCTLVLIITIYLYNLYLVKHFRWLSEYMVDIAVAIAISLELALKREANTGSYMPDGMG